MSELGAPAAEKRAHVWQRDEHDFYIEPAWVWDRLFEQPGFVSGMTVLDPACGIGTCVQAAGRAGFHALGSDIVPRWEGRDRTHGIFAQSDFLAPQFEEGGWPVHQTAGWQFPDVIASNPPFKSAQEFAALALRRSVGSVCLLLPSKWVQGAKRARWLETTPLHRVLFLCPRPSMPPGHVLLAGAEPGNGTTDFAIFWWLRGYSGAPTIGWLQREPRP